MAIETPLINGQSYDWSQITVAIAGVPVAGISALNYEETQEKVNNFGRGKRPVSRGRGRIETTASITLHMEELERIQLAAPNRNILEIPAFDITVTFENAQGVANHVLKNCEFAKNARSLEEGSTGIQEELDLVLSHIVW